MKEWANQHQAAFGDNECQTSPASPPPFPSPFHQARSLAPSAGHARNSSCGGEPLPTVSIHPLVLGTGLRSWGLCSLPGRSCKGTARADHIPRSCLYESPRANREGHTGKSEGCGERHWRGARAESAGVGLGPGSLLEENREAMEGG